MLQQRDAPRAPEWGGLSGCIMCLCCSEGGTEALMDSSAAYVALKLSLANKCGNEDALGTTKKPL